MLLLVRRMPLPECASASVAQAGHSQFVEYHRRPQGDPRACDPAAGGAQPRGHLPGLVSLLWAGVDWAGVVTSSWLWEIGRPGTVFRLGCALSMAWSGPVTAAATTRMSLLHCMLPAACHSPDHLHTAPSAPSLPVQVPHQQPAGQRIQRWHRARVGPSGHRQQRQRARVCVPAHAAGRCGRVSGADLLGVEPRWAGAGHGRLGQCSAAVQPRRCAAVVYERCCCLFRLLTSAAAATLPAHASSGTLLPAPTQPHHIMPAPPTLACPAMQACCGRCFRGTEAW